MTATFALPPRCTLVQAEGIASDCRAAIAAGGGLVIDAGALQEADVSLLQILIAAGKCCAAGGHSMSLLTSPVLDGLAARAGLVVGGAGLSPAPADPHRP